MEAIGLYASTFAASLAGRSSFLLPPSRLEYRGKSSEASSKVWPFILPRLPLLAECDKTVLVCLPRAISKHSRIVLWGVLPPAVRM